MCYIFVRMKNIVLQFAVLSVLFISCSDKIPSEEQNFTKAELKTVTFEKSGEVILNPGQGWMLYGHPVSHNAATIALGTTGYHRFRWNMINPQEGVYDWTDIDNHISRWAALGKQFAFGINMSVSPESVETYIPQWIFDKGMRYDAAKYTNSSSTRDFYIPVWDDPVFLGALRKFIAALADRYDGNENIAFIDIRIYGLWGELHWDNVSNYTKRLNDTQVANLHQIYPDRFKKTKLVQNFPQSPLTRTLNRWAVDNGIGLRGDGIMGPEQWGSTSGRSLTEAIGKEFVIWEWWGTLKEYLGPDPKYVWDEERFVRIIRENKPNYIGMGKWGDDAQYMTNHKPELARMVANMMGYHFAMTSAKYTNVLEAGEAKEITVNIENTGVTTMLTSCVIKILLLDDNDKVVSSFTTDWDAKTFKAGETTELKANVSFAGAPVGSYKLAIGFYRNENDTESTYKIDNKNKTDNGFYIIENLRIVD
jgi:Beta-galactosidase.